PVESNIGTQMKQDNDQPSDENLLLDKKPLKSDLLRLFKSSAAHYMIIGTALDLEVDDLLPYPAATTSNLIQVFKRWIDSNKRVTWRKVLQVCDDFPEELGRAKADVEEFLSSDRARENYQE
uniref:Death domain-containing protein n=2 Tax=Amphimedon queenslandica TaxID=400682 RepID=A0A1X7SUU9_AMPQE